MVLVSTEATRPIDSGRIDRPARLARCLERARNGDRSALDDIVRELNPLLWHVARAQSLTTEHAADVVQTTWLEFLRRLHQIRSPEALTAWLVTTTRREAWRVQDRQRRQTVDGTEALASLPAPDPGPAEHLVHDERSRILLRHFRLLPERCRTLLRVVAEADRPDYAVIAEALGMPHGSIGPTRGRCLAKLREMLMADPSWRAS
jgi:RNA polymerase sigma factor (sigma-70 family)